MDNIVRLVAQKLGVVDNPAVVSALEKMASLPGFSVDAAVEVVECSLADDHDGMKKALQRFKESIPKLTN